MSWRSSEKGDMFWCTLDCDLPVSNDHKCEQWGSTYKIPKKAIEYILKNAKEIKKGLK